jgi:hypothetical protein
VREQRGDALAAQQQLRELVLHREHPLEVALVLARLAHHACRVHEHGQLGCDRGHQLEVLGVEVGADLVDRVEDADRFALDPQRDREQAGDRVAHREAADHPRIVAGVVGEVPLAGDEDGGRVAAVGERDAVFADQLG